MPKGLILWVWGGPESLYFYQVSDETHAAEGTTLGEASVVSVYFFQMVTER